MNPFSFRPLQVSAIGTRASLPVPAREGVLEGNNGLSTPGPSEPDDPRADLDRRLGPLAGGDDRLGVALAESAEDEETGDTRLARPPRHDLEPFDVALQGEALEVLVVEGDPSPPHDDLAGDDAPVREPYPFEALLAEKLLRPTLNPSDPLLIEECRILRRQGEAVCEEGHVAGEHLLHTDAEANAVDGAVYD